MSTKTTLEEAQALVYCTAENYDKPCRGKFHSSCLLKEEGVLAKNKAAHHDIDGYMQLSKFIDKLWHFYMFRNIQKVHF